MAALPSHDPGVFASSLENTLARLRRTERQFREASILAALDIEARQLFTFYKKVDIANAKDQKTLLSKFGSVLRTNTCTIAYKTAARLPDLLKPEQARLYRLFTAAIISSIKLHPTGELALQPLGLNTYLVEQTPLESESNHFGPVNPWCLHRVELQIVPSGHLVLTIVKVQRQTFLRLSELGQDIKSAWYPGASHTALYLAPIGRIARLTGEVAVGRQASDLQKELWKELLPAWLKDNMNAVVDTRDISWIEAEIPVLEPEASTPDSRSLTSSENEARAVTWRTVFWPANLCFMPGIEKPPLDENFGDNQDPVQFVQDWIAGTGNGFPSIGEHQTQYVNMREEDDEPLFADDGAFDDPEHFQPFGPPAFPPSQTIYPTPPDVMMTLPTPGLSSVDGIAMTPANPIRGLSDLVHHQDEEMQDYEDIPTNRGMDEFYDEDLFEEMPDDNFGPEGAGDEPNWDFFDRPGMESKITPNPVSSGHDSKHSDAMVYMTDPGSSMPPDHEAMSSERPKIGNRGDPAHSTAPLAGQASANFQASPRQMEESNETAPLSTDQTAHFSSEQDPMSIVHGAGNDPARPASSQRRSSIYGGIYSAHISNRDSKYATNGDYWFDPNPARSEPKNASKFTPIYQKPMSLSSEGDSSVTSTSLPDEHHISATEAFAPSRQWTEYHPDSPRVTSQHGEVEKNSAQQEIQQLLALLKPEMMDTSAAVEFNLVQESQSIPYLSAQKFLQIAHILVDQVSQTSLLPHNEASATMRDHYNDRMEVRADFTGLNTSATLLNLLQLVGLKTDGNSNARIQGKVAKIPPQQICLRRAEQPLVASASILGFWDTLNLQPESGAKNVTAFCVHPAGDNVADGCFNLLRRMKDTYNTCALGTHAIGRIPSLTSNGLIGWKSTESAPTSLYQTCQMTGNAIGAASNLKGTVIVYMISQSDSPASYLEVCHAFNGLFGSFMQSMSDKQGVSDIALQVIPRGFVANAESLVVPDQHSYIRLAIEVYNRLPPSNLAAPPAACGSAVVLAKAENSVHLQLTSTSGPLSSQNGPCLHLAFAASADERWITAAWSDEFGRIALTMSYCVRRRDSVKKRPRAEIFTDMWQVSHDLMSKSRGAWRLAVIKHGYHDDEELQEWHQIFDASSQSQKQCSPMLLSIDLDPGLRIFPQLPIVKAGQGTLQNLYGTPASTPQASITSPDQLVPATPTPGSSSIMNASTPPEPAFDPSMEGDLTLVDLTEESWLIVLPYGVNQTTSMTEPRPALATGLLMKRKGAKNEDGCSRIEISLISTSTQAAESPGETPADDLLEDVIKQYRGLVTLGMTRGCIDPLGECIPWHIATAIRGAQTLGEVM